MNTAYLNLIANAGRSAITHIGLVNGSGTELSSADYARQPVTWTAASDGDTSPNADLVFEVAAGDVVAGWRGYSAGSGGTDYGGADLTPVTFANDGTYTLDSATTGIDHDAT